MCYLNVKLVGLDPSEQHLSSEAVSSDSVLVLFTDDALNAQERHEGLLRELQELAEHGQ